MGTDSALIFELLQLCDRSGLLYSVGRKEKLSLFLRISTDVAGHASIAAVEGSGRLLTWCLRWRFDDIAD
jgi:hypothetical protein